MTKLFATAIACALTSSAAFAAGAPAPSAKSVLDQIAKQGGHKVLWDLWKHDKEFSRVISGIETGNAAWLKVAAQLRPFADGGASLSIDYAIAQALPKSPEAILAYVGHGFELDYICTSPFIEPEPGVAKKYEQQTLRALANIKTPKLVPLATACAKEIRLPAGA